MEDIKALLSIVPEPLILLLLGVGALVLYMIVGRPPKRIDDGKPRRR